MQTDYAARSEDTVLVAARDRGLTLTEVLVAVVLLGTVVLSVIGAVQASVIGSYTERDHAKAYQWLQSAVGVLQSVDRVGCDLSVDDTYSTGEEKVRLSYQTSIRTTVINPPGWTDSQLTVVTPIQVWDGTRYWNPADALTATGKDCFDSDGFELQLITIQVTSPDGRILETLQVVKDGVN